MLDFGGVMGKSQNKPQQNPKSTVFLWPILWDSCMICLPRSSWCLWYIYLNTGTYSNTCILLPWFSPGGLLTSTLGFSILFLNPGASIAWYKSPKSQWKTSVTYLGPWKPHLANSQFFRSPPGPFVRRWGLTQTDRISEAVGEILPLEFAVLFLKTIFRPKTSNPPRLVVTWKKWW